VFIIHRGLIIYLFLLYFHTYHLNALCENLPKIWVSSYSIACSKIIWLRGLLTKLSVPQTIVAPFYADNTSAIQITKSTVFMNTQAYWGELIFYQGSIGQSCYILLPQVISQLQLVDIFIKVVLQPHHQFPISKLMLLDQPHQFEGRCYSRSCG